jgi:hypothetical protein
MNELILQSIYYSAFVGVVACLISESKILEPIRERLSFSLFYCPICLGFWLALPFLFWFGLFFYFSVVGFSNAWMLLILKTYEALDKTYEEDDASSTMQQKR